MGLTNQKAVELATQALEKGKILHVRLYSKPGVVTAGPYTPAVPAFEKYAIYPGDPSLKNVAQAAQTYRHAIDAACWLVSHCGRSNVRIAVEKAEA